MKGEQIHYYEQKIDEPATKFFGLRAARPFGKSIDTTRERKDAGGIPWQGPMMAHTGQTGRWVALGAITAMAPRVMRHREKCRHQDRNCTGSFFNL
jgi:hypothetical protein